MAKLNNMSQAYLDLLEYRQSNNADLNKVKSSEIDEQLDTGDTLFGKNYQSFMINKSKIPKLNHPYFKNVDLHKLTKDDMDKLGYSAYLKLENIFDKLSLTINSKHRQLPKNIIDYMSTISNKLNKNQINLLGAISQTLRLCKKLNILSSKEIDEYELFCNDVQNLFYYLDH